MDTSLWVVQDNAASIPVDLEHYAVLLGVQLLLYLRAVLNIERETTPRSVTTQAAQHRPNRDVSHV